MDDKGQLIGLLDTLTDGSTNILSQTILMLRYFVLCAKDGMKDSDSVHTPSTQCFSG